MQKRTIVTNILILVVLLVIIFLSQQPYFNTIGKQFYSKIQINTKIYWTNIKDWLENNVYPRVSGEVESKSGIIQQEINKQKNNIAQNIWLNIKNYFADVFTKISGTPVQ